MSACIIAGVLSVCPSMQGDDVNRDLMQMIREILRGVEDSAHGRLFIASIRLRRNAYGAQESDDVHFLTQVASLYYEENYTQERIARIIGTSRSGALRTGIVKVLITDEPYARAVLKLWAEISTA